MPLFYTCCRSNLLESVFFYFRETAVLCLSLYGWAGLLRGMHNLDTCDPFVVPPPVDLEALAEGQAGEGMVSNTGEFPLAESSVRFLEAHLESWRRLECIQESPGTSMVLTGLPQGLAVLSLQVNNALHCPILRCNVPPRYAP